MNSKITVVMPLKNEAKYLCIIEDICNENPGIVHEIIIMDDASTDGSLNILKKISGANSQIKIHTNDENLPLNQMIAFLLSKVTTELVHIRAPHDYYSQNFYKFHLNRFLNYPEIISSVNYVRNESSSKASHTTKFKFNPFFSKIYARFFDINISSCGFIAKTSFLQKAWDKYMNFGEYCDWLVKKEVSQLNNFVYSFEELSVYNDMLKIKAQESTLGSYCDDKAKEFFKTIIHNFWKIDSSRRCFTFPYQLYDSNVKENCLMWEDGSKKLTIHFYLWLIINMIKSLRWNAYKSL